MSLSEKEKALVDRLREECAVAVDKAPRRALEEIVMSVITIYAIDQFVGPLSLETIKYMTNKTLLVAMSHGLLEKLKCGENEVPSKKEPEWMKRARRAVVGGDPNAN